MLKSVDLLDFDGQVYFYIYLTYEPYRFVITYYNFSISWIEIISIPYKNDGMIRKKRKSRRSGKVDGDRYDEIVEREEERKLFYLEGRRIGLNYRYGDIKVR